MHISADTNIVAGVAGGVLIGVASSALLYAAGKITGISGIAHTLVTARSFHSLTGWRLSYIAGLLGTGAVLQVVWPASLGDASKLRPWAAVVAGLLVGFGTRLGSGCTSGHGVCGLPRLSPRSLVAVLSFMATGAASATLVRSSAVAPYVFQASPFTFVPPATPAASAASAGWLAILPTVGVIAASLFLFRKPNWFKHGDGHTEEEPIATLAEHGVALASSAVFAVALAAGGMVNPSVVQSFLDFTGAAGWNPTLMGVMGGAVVINLATFPAMRRCLTRPLLEPKRTFADIISFGASKPNTNINWQLITGSAIFGVGWGLAGMCPGPALVSLGARTPLAGVVVPSMLAGMAIYEATLGAGLWHSRHHHHGHKHGHGHAHTHAHAAPAPGHAAAGAEHGAAHEHAAAPAPADAAHVPPPALAPVPPASAAAVLPTAGSPLGDADLHASPATPLLAGNESEGLLAATSSDVTLHDDAGIHRRPAPAQ